jgi:hypothetical protein
MSRIVVNFDKIENQSDLSSAAENAKAETATIGSGGKRSVWRTIVKTLLLLLVAFLLIGGIGGYFYWQHYKTTPAYSLALVVEAARKDDKAALGRLVDTDKIVDAFVPQITDKAVELYGRGMPPELIQKLARVAAPALPAVKERARAELPGMIREKTKAAENVPFFLVALGASQALEIKEENGSAWVKSTMPDRPLEIKMQKNGDVWQIVEVKDEALARKIAEQIGQQIISAAGNGTRTDTMPSIPNLNELLKRAEEAFK